VFTEIKQAFQKDRFAYFTEFFKNFYNTDKLLGKRISKQVVRWSWNAASESSPIGSLASIDAWLTDFREDASKIDIPTLIIHGGEDRILPIESTAKPLQKRIEGSRLVELSDGPHGLLWTHAEEVNAELVKFLSESARKNARSQKANKKTSASRPNLQ
jgi:pimeloyl-ACP methyl ester carboxylesterase